MSKFLIQVVNTTQDQNQVTRSVSENNGEELEITHEKETTKSYNSYLVTPNQAAFW